MMLQVKKLDSDSLTKLQCLEQTSGYCVVALEAQSKLPKLADVSEKELKELQSLEKDLNSVLLAYKC